MKESCLRGTAMLEAVLMKLKDALPGARIIPAPSAFLTNTAVYRYFPGKSGGRRKSGRLEVRFVSPSLAGAMAMYGSVRSALVSEADFDRVGRGIRAVHVEEVAEGSSCGYIRKSGLYFVKSGFLLTGY